MTDLKLFGLSLDKSGSNISALDFIFSERSGINFRKAIGQAFRFAEELVSIAKKVEPEHKLELWDQAVKRRLELIIQEMEPILANDARLLLEKTSGTNEVWKYGIHIFESEINTGVRFWNLPDGLIQTDTYNVALEFDHGGSIGKWATQLVKAIRSTASPKINGVLFCFCLEKQSAHSLFLGKQFTTEFQTLVGNVQKKPVGIITIDQAELSSYARPTAEELTNLLHETYRKVPVGQELADRIKKYMAG